MNPELLLERFSQDVNKIKGEVPKVSGEVLVQGSRVEIIFIPDAPRSDDEQKVRDGVREAVEVACSSEAGGAHSVDPQLGHLAIANATSTDIGLLNSLPGVMLKQTVV